MSGIPDTIDAIAGIAPGSALSELRRGRADIHRHSQGSHDVLVTPAEPGGVSSAERAALALRVALASKDERLSAHYRDLLLRAAGDDMVAAVEHPSGGDASTRLAAMLRHVDMLTKAPREATQGALRKLEAAGLSNRDIVAISQLVAFVSFQERVIAGLRLLDGRNAGIATGPRGERTWADDKRFTLQPVGWDPWLPLVPLDTTDPAERAAFEATPLAQRTGAYIRTLAHDPASLAERSPLFHSVMYVPRGLPRPERELSTVIVSMINGCIYCASVHARRFAELTKKPEVAQRLFDEGIAAGIEPRLRAVADFAEKLTREPGRMTPADLAPLKAQGLTELEMLDLVHATAMFANANRLMQSLGDSMPPAEA